MKLFPVYLKELFKVAATDFTADIVVTQHVLAHPVKVLCPVLNSFTQ
jgi:hypothetical protein